MVRKKFKKNVGIYKPERPAGYPNTAAALAVRARELDQEVTVRSLHEARPGRATRSRSHTGVHRDRSHERLWLEPIRWSAPLITGHPATPSPCSSRTTCRRIEPALIPRALRGAPGRVARSVANGPSQGAIMRHSLAVVQPLPRSLSRLVIPGIAGRAHRERWCCR